jgi:proteic killer suppression protein
MPMPLSGGEFPIFLPHGRHVSQDLTAMIVSFGDEDTEELFEKESNRRFAQMARVALRKLLAVDAAEQLQDLAVPPGNRLEALKGRAAGWHSIRINDQWRIVFRWTPEGPAEVGITDYH